MKKFFCLLVITSIMMSSAFLSFASDNASKQELAFQFIEEVVSTPFDAVISSDGLQADITLHKE